MMAAVASRFLQPTALAASPLPGVSVEQWDQLVRVCSVQGIGDVSESGGYGFLDMRARRLGELGWMENLRGERRGNRQVWVGDWVESHSEEEFLGSMVVQVRAFKLSMKDYDARLTAGGYRVPVGVKRSGALVILHRGGRGALESWPEGALSHTMVLYEKAANLF